MWSNPLSRRKEIILNLNFPCLEFTQLKWILVLVFIYDYAEMLPRRSVSDKNKTNSA